MPIPSLTISRSLEIKHRKLDLLWVALSMVLAVFTWRYAIPDAYTPIWLFVALHIQCAFIFAIRQPARYSTKRPLEILVTLLSLIYFLAFEVKPTSSAVLGSLGWRRHCHRLTNNDHFHPVLGPQLRRAALSSRYPNLRRVSLRASSHLSFLHGRRAWHPHAPPEPLQHQRGSGRLRFDDVAHQVRRAITRAGGDLS